jgi:hypothetical protein
MTIEEALDVTCRANPVDTSGFFFDSDVQCHQVVFGLMKNTGFAWGSIFSFWVGLFFK